MLELTVKQKRCSVKAASLHPHLFVSVLELTVKRCSLVCVGGGGGGHKKERQTPDVVGLKMGSVIEWRWDLLQNGGGVCYRMEVGSVIEWRWDLL